MKRQAVLLFVALGLVGCDRGTRQDDTAGYYGGNGQEQEAYGGNGDVHSPYATEDRSMQQAQDGDETGQEIREEGQEMAEDVRTGAERVAGEAREAGQDVREEGREMRGEAREELQETEERGRAISERARHEAREEGAELREEAEQGVERAEQKVDEATERMRGNGQPPPTEPIVPRKEVEEFKDTDIQRLDDEDLRGITDESIELGAKKLEKDVYENRVTGTFADHAKRLKELRTRAGDNPDVLGEISRIETRLGEARKLFKELENTPVDRYQDHRQRLNALNDELDNSLDALEARVRGMNVPQPQPQP